MPIIIVDKVAETGGVDDGEPESDAVLLDVCARYQTGCRQAGITALTCGDALNSDCFGTLCVGREGLLARVERSVEERVDERGLAQAGLACEGAGEYTESWRERKSTDRRPLW